MIFSGLQPSACPISVWHLSQCSSEFGWKMQLSTLFSDKWVSVFMLLSPICCFFTNDKMSNCTVSHTVFALLSVWSSDCSYSWFVKLQCYYLWQEGRPKCNICMNVNGFKFLNHGEVPVVETAVSGGKDSLSDTAQEKRYCTLYLGLICPDFLLYPVQPKQIRLHWENRLWKSPYTSHSGYFILTQCLPLPHSICLSVVVICLFSSSCIYSLVLPASRPSVSSLRKGYLAKRYAQGMFTVSQIDWWGLNETKPWVDRACCSKHP